jgi:hypothetical protein
MGYDAFRHICMREKFMNIRRRSVGIWPILIALLYGAAAAAAQPVTHLQVRIVTGATELTAGSVVELRLYEVGRAVRRLPLTHGESWPADSTRLIPLTLTDPLDPRTVLRFGLYYRAASPLSPDWEVVDAEVDVAPDRDTPQRLLNITLSGVLSHQGELATEERATSALMCSSDADCDNHRNCDGHERCAPHTPNADARGCVKGLPVVCPVNQVCSEEHGCRGLQ